MTQRVALVTGAMGGIGTAICQELAKAGHKVVAAYHPEFDKPAEWTKAMSEAGFNDFICVAGDVSDYDSCVAWLPRPKPRRVRSTFWSTTPASPVTRCLHGWNWRSGMR
jgi:NAD(P)-dependent dehydrogenase (short-subunit alcohol dehydrogenase family)